MNSGPDLSRSQGLAQKYPFHHMLLVKARDKAIQGCGEIEGKGRLTPLLGERSSLHSKGVKKVLVAIFGDICCNGKMQPHLMLKN